MINLLKLRATFTFAIITMLLASIVFAAVPEGPGSLTFVNSSRRVSEAYKTHDAYAGNVTVINLNGQSITQTWAAYVGNVTGTITLDNSDGQTIYDWELADPEGEVYATYIPSVSWATGNILCWNWTDPTAEKLQLAELEQGIESNGGAATNPDLTSTLGAYGLGLAATDMDGVDETFNYSTLATSTATQQEHSSFYVGGQEINGTLGPAAAPRDSAGGGAPCPVVKLYNGSTENKFQEVLLYDNTNNGVIFTSIINLNQEGFNNNTYDFEMIVGENGHDGNIDTTTYYFYVELE